MKNYELFENKLFANTNCAVAPKLNLFQRIALRGAIEQQSGSVTFFSQNRFRKGRNNFYRSFMSIVRSAANK